MVERYGVVGAIALVLCVACGTSLKDSEPLQILAEGEGIRITKEGFDDYLERVPPFARQQMSDEELLERYIRSELLYVDALNQALDRDPEVRGKIDVMIKQLLEREYFQREMDEKLGIDDEVVRNYYKDHIERFRQPENKKCWHILCKTREDAEQAKQTILNGEEFTVVARRVSIDDKTREDGGKLGIFPREKAPDELRQRPVLLDTLFSLPSGRVSEVVETDLGFHVLRAYTAKVMPYKPLEDVAREIREEILVPDSAVARYYSEHPESYQSEERIRLRLIRLADREAANDVRERILNGEDMAALARELSMDTTGKRSGGLTGWIKRDEPIRGIGRDPEFEEAIWTMEVGSVGAVFKTMNGFYVFRVEDRAEAGVKPIDEVRGSIRSQLLVDAKRDAVEAAFERLKGKYQIRRKEGGRKSSQKSALQTSVDRESTTRKDNLGEEELFSLAQSESDPTERLDTYREIVRRFPDGERADESQFMIGFVLAEELGDTSGGRGAYEEVLRRYPKSDWVDDAQAMLRILAGDHDVTASEGEG